MQKHVNLVDLFKSFPTNIYLQNLASLQKRTSRIKFAHLAEESDNGSVSNLSTKVHANGHLHHGRAKLHRKVRAPLCVQEGVRMRARAPLVTRVRRRGCEGHLCGAQIRKNGRRGLCFLSLKQSLLPEHL